MFIVVPYRFVSVGLGAWGPCSGLHTEPEVGGVGAGLLGSQRRIDPPRRTGGVVGRPVGRSCRTGSIDGVKDGERWAIGYLRFSLGPAGG